MRCAGVATALHPSLRACATSPATVSFFDSWRNRMSAVERGKMARAAAVKELGFEESALQSLARLMAASLMAISDWFAMLTKAA